MNQYFSRPEIENDVAIPEKKPKSKYRFHELEIGQSISWPKSERNAIGSRISVLHRMGSKRFRVAVDPKDSEHVRIWRVDDVPTLAVGVSPTNEG